MRAKNGEAMREEKSRNEIIRVEPKAQVVVTVKQRPRFSPAGAKKIFKRKKEKKNNRRIKECHSRTAFIRF